MSSCSILMLTLYKFQIPKQKIYVTRAHILRFTAITNKKYCNVTFLVTNQAEKMLKTKLKHLKVKNDDYAYMCNMQQREKEI